MLILGCDNRLYLLLHLSSFKKNVGQKVYIGDVVAEVGNTGYSNGAHLHLEVFRTPEIDFETAFVKKDGINNSITIYAKTNPIVNPFNFEEKYTNGDNY